MKVKSSYILLDHLRFHAFHGVLPQEQKTGGEYDLSLRIKYDITLAMQSDDVADTLNYAEVYEIARREMNMPRSLLENVCGRIGQQLFEHFPEIEEVGIRLIKSNPPMGADSNGAGVELLLINNKTTDKV